MSVTNVVYQSLLKGRLEYNISIGDVVKAMEPVTPAKVEHSAKKPSRGLSKETSR